MKNIYPRMLAFLLVVFLLAGCTPAGSAPKLNGTELSAYTIVYSEAEPDYNLRAAQHIQSQIKERTGVELSVCEATSGTYEHEIVVGETNRAISSRLTAETENVEFAILADENHIALEGDYFIIAAAAYYFVQTYIPGKSFESTVPQEITVHTPITEKANNFIFLIGDGMGFNQTKLLEEYDISEYAEDSDNERIFYGNYLPYQGMIHTGSLSGVTDSAAAATALACGYKTINHYVGKDSEGNDLKSLTELAMEQGRAAAVLSTDSLNGATPAGFTAHAMDRDDTNEIMACIQDKLKNGVIVLAGLQSSARYQTTISETLTELEADEDGFFFMYEEGYIDKFAHKMQIEGTLVSVGRFNQAIGVFMEYAFYHPDTFLIITADHETGGLMPNAEGKLEFNTSDHTGSDVPIYGYGQGAEVFDSCDMENTQIPKIIAGLWGVSNFGDQSTN